MNAVKKYVLTPYVDDQQNISSQDEITSNDNSTIQSSITKKTILLTIPKNKQQKAKILIDNVSPHISWNQNGEVTINGSFIQHSHIIDLIKKTLDKYKTNNPIGYDQFSRLLQRINIPKFVVSKPLQQGKGPTYPPPGIPDKLLQQGSGVSLATRIQAKPRNLKHKWIWMTL